MTIYKCDKCGTELGERGVRKTYIEHESQLRDLCSTCQKKYYEAIKKASKEFFK